MMVQLSRMGLWRPGALTPVDGRGGERQTPGHLTRQCGGQFVQRRSDGRAQPWPERQIASVWVNPVKRLASATRKPASAWCTAARARPMTSACLFDDREDRWQAGCACGLAPCASGAV